MALSLKLFTYHIQPNELIPNSPKPLLHYKGVFLKDGKVDFTSACDTYRKNGWEIRWATQYGHEQQSHYDNTSHEAITVLSGPGVIRWGTAADSSDISERAQHEDLVTEVDVGDVFVVPAGVARKSFTPRAAAAQTAGDADADSLTKLSGDLLSTTTGLTIMGAYPQGSNSAWGQAGEDAGRDESIWDTQNPAMDPIVGEKGGTNKYWKHQSQGFKTSL